MTDLLRQSEVRATISWNQALNAIEEMLINPNPERFSSLDVDRLSLAAAKINRMVKSRSTSWGTRDTNHTPRS